MGKKIAFKVEVKGDEGEEISVTVMRAGDQIELRVTKVPKLPFTAFGGGLDIYVSAELQENRLEQVLRYVCNMLKQVGRYLPWFVID